MDNLTGSAPSDDAGDLVYGAAAIGREINATPAQVRRFYKNGVLKGAVAKFGWRTFVGSRKQLRNLKLTDAPKQL